jgi:hypothetical protein
MDGLIDGYEDISLRMHRWMVDGRMDGGIN